MKIILVFTAMLGLTLSAWATDAEFTDCYDAALSRWGDDGHRNDGGSQQVNTHPTDPEPYLMRWDLTSLGSSPITVTAVACSIYCDYGSGTPKAHIIGGLMTTEWTEGVETGATVSDGNPGCTYSFATDVYPSGSGGADVSWAASLWGTGDYTTGTRDSAIGPVSGWMVFDSSGLYGDIEDWVDGTTSNYGWAIWCTESAGTRVNYSTAEKTPPATRPRMWITYTVDAAEGNPQVIIIGSR